MTTALAPANPVSRTAASLTRPEKAAIVVQLLLAEEAEFSLQDLPIPMQTALARDIINMRSVDRGTLEIVVAEFIAEVENLGLSFSNSFENTLKSLEGKISNTTLARLKRERGIQSTGDPWERIGELPAETLVPIVAGESIEVAAVILSKVPVPLAAETLGAIPGAQARRIAYAVSQTGTIAPRVVDRIGQTVLAQTSDTPDLAFDDLPVDRVGAILNSATSATRDDVLEGLEEADATFASEVRKAIFTFANIPGRLAPRDVPKVIKEVDGDALLIALASAKIMGEDEAVDFIFENISQRMASQMRESLEEMEPVPEEEAEGHMQVVTETIRRLEADGTISLIAEG